LVILYNAILKPYFDPNVKKLLCYQIVILMLTNIYNTKFLSFYSVGQRT